MRCVDEFDIRHMEPVVMTKLALTHDGTNSDCEGVECDSEWIGNDSERLGRECDGDDDDSE